MEVVKVKQYSSTNKYVLLIDGVPVAITRGGARASLLMQYVEGFDVDIQDGRLKKVLDKYREEKLRGEK